MIYICIPSYNEERTIGVLLWKIRQVMAAFPRDYQLLVLDDASSDATPDILEPYTRVLPLTVIRHAQRTGYAGALEKLIRETVRRAPYPRRDIAVALQADFTEEPEEIPTLVKRIEGGVDIVTSTPDRGAQPALPRWTHRGLGLLLRRYEWHDAAGDPLSGFRAYRVICLKKAIAARDGRPLLTLDGWAANAELLRAVQPYARRMAVAPVELHHERRGRATRFRFIDAAGQFMRLLRVSPSMAGAGPSAQVGTASDRSEPATTPARRRGGRSESRRRGRASEASGTAEAGRSDGEQPSRRRTGSSGRGRRGRRTSPGAGSPERHTGGEA